MPFFCDLILRCYSRKYIISLVEWYLLWRLFSLLAMLVVAKKLIEPIAELTAATKRVGEEQFSGTLHINRKDEIGQLAQSFQRMTEKLVKMIEIAKNSSVMYRMIFNLHY